MNARFVLLTLFLVVLRESGDGEEGDVEVGIGPNLGVPGLESVGVENVGIGSKCSFGVQFDSFCGSGLWGRRGVVHSDAGSFTG